MREVIVNRYDAVDFIKDVVKLTKEGYTLDESQVHFTGGSQSKIAVFKKDEVEDSTSFENIDNGDDVILIDDSDTGGVRSVPLSGLDSVEIKVVEDSEIPENVLKVLYDDSSEDVDLEGDDVDQTLGSLKTKEDLLDYAGKMGYEVNNRLGEKKLREQIHKIEEGSIPEQPDEGAAGE